MRVLILGGTGEARALAEQLHAAGADVVSSLAGRVSNPALPVGGVRIGGFGGVSGLAAYLREQRFDAVVDATHPFAATITAHAVVASAQRDAALLLLRRPGWTADAGDRWQRVPNVASAAAAVLCLAVETVFLTTGRRDLALFAGDATHRFLVRTVDPPDGPVPSAMTLLLDRGPYSVAGERSLMIEHDVGALVTKDSGGSMTAAKLTAARDLGLPVIMVDRPPPPAGIPLVDSVEAALAWLGFGAVGDPGRGGIAPRGEHP